MESDEGWVRAIAGNTVNRNSNRMTIRMEGSNPRMAATL